MWKDDPRIVAANPVYALARPQPGPDGKRRPMTSNERTARYRAKKKALRILADPVYAAAQAEKAANHARIAAYQAHAQEQAQNCLKAPKAKLADVQATGTAEEIYAAEREIRVYKERQQRAAKQRPWRNRSLEAQKRRDREAAGLPPRVRRKRAKTPEELLARLNGDKRFC